VVRAGCDGNLRVILRRVLTPAESHRGRWRGGGARSGAAGRDQRDQRDQRCRCAGWGARGQPAARRAAVDRRPRGREAARPSTGPHP